MVSATRAKKRQNRFQAFNALTRFPDFRYLWLCQLFYNIGHWMQSLVFGWLAYEMTGSPFLVSVFAAARMAPMLLGPFGGALADKLNRRHLLMFLQSFSALAGGIGAFLAFTDRLEYWHLIVIGFSTGMVWSVSDATRNAMTVDIVGTENISNAVALNIMAFYTTWVIGPSLGGMLLPLFGVAGCLVITTGWYIMAVLILFPMKFLNKSVLGYIPVTRIIVDGFRYVSRHRGLLSVFSITLAANLFVWPAYNSLMPVLAKDSLGLGATGLGFLLTSFGAGALLGSFTIASLGKLKHKGFALPYRHWLLCHILRLICPLEGIISGSDIRCPGRVISQRFCRNAEDVVSNNGLRGNEG